MNVGQISPGAPSLTSRYSSMIVADFPPLLMVNSVPKPFKDRTFPATWRHQQSYQPQPAAQMGSNNDRWKGAPMFPVHLATLKWNPTKAMDRKGLWENIWMDTFVDGSSSG